MRQRVAIAAALAGDPRVLIADEPSTALDVVTQRQVLDLLDGLRRTRRMTLVLITHDLRVAFAVCDRVYVFYAGVVLESGPASELARAPMHPYTQALVLSEPAADGRLATLNGIPGRLPRAGDVEGQCAFASRCSWCRDECVTSAPPLTLVAEGRWSACRLIPTIRDEVAAAHAAGKTVVSPEPRPVPNELLRVTGIRKVFSRPAKRGGIDQVVALDGVSITVGAGESVGVVGESGSGKTTLGRLIVGLEDADEGEILLAGTDATRRDALADAEMTALRHSAQFVFQDPYSSLNPMRTVGSILSQAVRFGGYDGDNERTLEQLLSDVGLPVDYVKRKPAALSGGERQRVAIARALAVNPRLLVCDEPVSALDVSVQAQLLELFRRLHVEHDVAYLFITHDLGVVRQIADRIYVLYRGKVVESGPTEQVLSAPTHPYTGRLVAAIPRRAAVNISAQKPAPPSQRELRRRSKPPWQLEF